MEIGVSLAESVFHRDSSHLQEQHQQPRPPLEANSMHPPNRTPKQSTSLEMKLPQANRLPQHRETCFQEMPLSKQQPNQHNQLKLSHQLKACTSNRI